MKEVWYAQTQLSGRFRLVMMSTLPWATHIATQTTRGLVLPAFIIVFGGNKENVIEGCSERWILLHPLTEGT